MRINSVPDVKCFGHQSRPEKARKCSAAQGPHSEVVPRAFWRLVSKSCDEGKGLFARGCEAKRWSHWTCSSLGTIFQPMRINSVPDIKCFGLQRRPEKARKCSAAQGLHSEVVPCALWRLVLKICDECKGSFARDCEAKRWSHWTCSSLGTIFQPMRINSVPDIKSFCNNKNVLRAQSIVWHFVRHPVCAQSLSSHHGGPGSIPGWSVWDL